MATEYERTAPRGLGWISFAAIMLGLAGLWNVLEGFLAIGKSRVYVNEETFVFSDLNTWGWIILVLGIATNKPFRLFARHRPLERSHPLGFGCE